MSGEVSTDDVLVIIARTRAENLDQLLRIVTGYHKEGNAWAEVQTNYNKLQEFELSKVLDLVWQLYHSGKIHQPSMVAGHGGFIHPELNRQELWLEVAPVPTTHHPSVVDAYSKYRMLATLMK
jgi:hypothetical protein